MQQNRSRFIKLAEDCQELELRLKSLRFGTPPKRWVTVSVDRNLIRLYELPRRTLGFAVNVAESRALLRAAGRTGFVCRSLQAARVEP